MISLEKKLDFFLRLISRKDGDTATADELARALGYTKSSDVDFVRNMIYTTMNYTVFKDTGVRRCSGYRGKKAIEYKYNKKNCQIFIFKELHPLIKYEMEQAAEGELDTKVIDAI